MNDEKMKKPVVEQKCPNCGSAIVFNPETGRAECPNCGTVFDLESEIRPQKDSIDRKKRDTAMKTMEPLPVYRCVSCGAEVLAENQTVSLTCPFCNNNIVLTEQISGALKPDGIVPFAFNSKELPDKVKQYYKGKRLLPKDFFTESRMGKVTGIYVPFWVYDCEVSGRVSYTGEQYSRSYRIGDYSYTDYDVYDLERSLDIDFKDLPVDASLKMDDALMDSLEPFSMDDLKPFDTLYLSGFVADRFDQSSEEMKKRADKRVLETAADLAEKEATSGYSSTSMKSMDCHTKIRKARYVLLPVYNFKIMYNNHEYEFAVNGQTGKVVGWLPTDEKRKKRLTFGTFGVVFAALLAVLIGFLS